MKYDHLLNLSTDFGVYEHCDGDVPLPEHGYCVDDVSRALIVAERAPQTTSELDGLADTCSQFLYESQMTDGTIINRCTNAGLWHGEADTRDHWGRALWAWGTVINRSQDAGRMSVARGAFERSAAQRSPYLRAMAFAGLGAAEVLKAEPDNHTARVLLADAAARVTAGGQPTWPWPEDRLTYANAAIAEVQILAGSLLPDHALLQRGLGQLVWLLSLQTRDGHLSPTPAGGWSRSEPLPGFDQQPIEVAHLVDACISAYEVSGDIAWLQAARIGGWWFYGDNDSRIWMHDPSSGAGYDGLKAGGRNNNRGAESTLAYLSVMQQVLAHGELP